VCAELPRIAVRTRVVVVMHRREAITSTNTGRLAARVLEGASVRVRGSLRGGDPEPLPEGRRLTLFPGDGVRMLEPRDALGDVVLLVPDGSWSQARRLARRDASMRGTELVTFAQSAPTRYGLRRSARDGGVCTMEAIARALAILEGPEIATQLEELLDAFVERARWVRSGRIAKLGPACECGYRRPEAVAPAR
jgi:DTW domain-containing protein YfiP